MKTLITSLLVLSVPFVAFSQNEWTAEKIMEYKNIVDTEISPDGKYIAYVVRVPLMKGEKSEYNSQIWVAASDGSFNEQYTRGEKSATSPQFSPDSRSFAFISNRNDKKNQVFVMRLMGGEPIQVTTAKTGVNSFKWSPNGEKIAYIMKDPLTEEEEKMKKEKRDVILVDKNFKYNHLYTTSVDSNEDEKRDVKRLTGGGVSCKFLQLVS